MNGVICSLPFNHYAFTLLVKCNQSFVRKVTGTKSMAYEVESRRERARWKWRKWVAVQLHGIGIVFGEEPLSVEFQSLGNTPGRSCWYLWVYQSRHKEKLRKSKRKTPEWSARQTGLGFYFYSLLTRLLTKLFLRAFNPTLNLTIRKRSKGTISTLLKLWSTPHPFITIVSPTHRQKKPAIAYI